MAKRTRKSEKQVEEQVEVEPQIEVQPEPQDAPTITTETVEPLPEAVESQSAPAEALVNTDEPTKVLGVMTVKNWFSAGYSKGQRGKEKVAPEGPEKLMAAWIRGYEAGTKKPVVRKGKAVKVEAPEPEYYI